MAVPRPPRRFSGEDPTVGCAWVDAGSWLRLRPLRRTHLVRRHHRGRRAGAHLAAGCRHRHQVGDRTHVRARISRIDPAQPPALGPRLRTAVLRRGRPSGQCGRRLPPGTGRLLQAGPVGPQHVSAILSHRARRSSRPLALPGNGGRFLAHSSLAAKFARSVRRRLRVCRRRERVTPTTGQRSGAGPRVSSLRTCSPG